MSEPPRAEEASAGPTATFRRRKPISHPPKPTLLSSPAITDDASAPEEEEEAVRTARLLAGRRGEAAAPGVQLSHLADPSGVKASGEESGSSAVKTSSARFAASSGDVALALREKAMQRFIDERLRDGPTAPSSSGDHETSGGSTDAKDSFDEVKAQTSAVATPFTGGVSAVLSEVVLPLEPGQRLAPAKKKAGAGGGGAMKRRRHF